MRYFLTSLCDRISQSVQKAPAASFHHHFCNKARDGREEAADWTGNSSVVGVTLLCNCRLTVGRDVRVVRVACLVTFVLVVMSAVPVDSLMISDNSIWELFHLLIDFRSSSREVLKSELHRFLKVFYWCKFILISVETAAETGLVSIALWGESANRC